MEKEKNYVGRPFIEFISVLVSYRKFLLSFVLGITLVVTLYALIAPKWYKSAAVVFPAEQTDFLGGLSGLSSLVKGFSATKGLASLTGNTETDRYVAILKSATIQDAVIKKFELRKVYDLEDTYYEKTVKELQSNTEFIIEDEGQLTIVAYDKDPQRAADMANYFVELLNAINSQIHVQSAKANREFIEKRYNQNVTDIKDLEHEMREFQESYGVVAVPEQLETTVGAMANIYGQLAEKEIELSVLENNLSKDHPLVNMARIEVRELKNKINRINEGEEFTDGGVNLLIPFKKAPELAGKYLKIYRDLEIQYKILEFITPLYEQAKVEEVRNTPSVVVLDHAGPAERKAKPRGSIYAIVTFIVTSFIGLFLVFSNELLKKIRENDSGTYSFIVSSIQSDLKKFPFLKRR